MKQKNGLIFDHDGTLVNSMNAVAICTNNVIKRAGLSTVSIENVKFGMAYPTLERFEFHTGLGDRIKLQDLSDEFYGELHKVGIGYLTLYDGIKETLEKLSACGYALGMVTNNQGLFVRKAAAYLKYAFDFEVILGEEDVPRTKPDPSGLLQACAGMGVPAKNCWYIGDGKPDCEAAEAAGMKSALVSWGAHPREELLNYKYDKLFDNSEELSDFFLNYKQEF